MSKQAIPDDSNCPYCGSEPTEESVVERNLSDLGYRHEDIALECQDCGEAWWHGIPIGEYEEGNDLLCASCEQHRMLVHRVQDRGRQFRLHLKCPNCYHFDKVDRTPDDEQIALVGYPAITGDADGAEPFGYEE